MGSLLAINIFLPAWIAFKIESTPINPEMAATTISISLSSINASKSLNKLRLRCLLCSALEKLSFER